MFLTKALSVAFLLSFFSSIIVFANPEDGKHPGMPHGKPPFVTACEEKKAGDQCTFNNHEEKTVNSVCKTAKNPRGEEELVCGDIPQPPKR